MGNTADRNADANDGLPDDPIHRLLLGRDPIGGDSPRLATDDLARRKPGGRGSRWQRGGLVDVDERVTVGAYLDRWLTTLSVRRKTARSYHQFVTLHLKPAIGRVRLTKLSPAMLRTLLAQKEQAGLSGRTVTLIRDVLRIALNQAVTDCAVPRNVAALVKRPKPTRRQGPILTAEQASVFLTQIQSTRLAPVVTIGLALGLRLREVLGLQWSGVDLEAGTVQVERGLETLGRERTLVALKSKESRRTVRLPEIVRAALVEQRRRQRERQLLAGGQCAPRVPASSLRPVTAVRSTAVM